MSIWEKLRNEVLDNGPCFCCVYLLVLFVCFFVCYTYLRPRSLHICTLALKVLTLKSTVQSTYRRSGSWILEKNKLTNIGFSVEKKNGRKEITQFDLILTRAVSVGGMP